MEEHLPPAMTVPASELGANLFVREKCDQALVGCVGVEVSFLRRGS